MYLNPNSHAVTAFGPNFFFFVRRLGAWQFLADMPYGSISLKTAWMVFWNIYCKDRLATGVGGANEAPPTSGPVNEEEEEESSEGQRARVMSPCSVDEIQVAIQGVHVVNFSAHTACTFVHAVCAVVCYVLC